MPMAPPPAGTEALHRTRGLRMAMLVILLLPEKKKRCFPAICSSNMMSSRSLIHSRLGVPELSLVNVPSLLCCLITVPILFIPSPIATLS